MRFAAHESVPFPAARVHAAERDELEAIVPFLPDVERVELRSQSRGAGGGVLQVHVWTGAASSLPLIARAFVRPEMLRWEQTTEWSASARVAAWAIAVPALGTAVEARGARRYLDAPAGCTVEVDGELWFRPQESELLRGVPASAIPMIERFVVGHVVPMITRTTLAVGRYLSGGSPDGP